MILDLDTSKSIKELGIIFDTKYLLNTINVLIDLAKTFGKNLGVMYKDIGNISQYQLSIKYLGHTLPIIIEFDNMQQYINFVYYNKDQSKSYLKLFLSINDEPTIKYIENDKSGAVPSYTDNNNNNNILNLKPGEYLINFSHCLMSYIGFNRMRLDDESCLITKDALGIDVRTKLWLYLLLTKKRSWYAKFGYIPANVSVCEYNMAIIDVQNIKLNEVSDCLKKISIALNKRNLDTNLVENSQFLIDLIGPSNETLIEYTLNHTLHEFTDLTNRLTQSIYGRTFMVQLPNTDLSPAINYQSINFPWFDKYKKLLVANTMQINNNIGDYFHKLT